jgi:hypothetical protein
MIACAAIVPLAVICGPIRGIPVWWTLIVISFGVVGIVPLLVAYRLIRRLEWISEGASQRPNDHLGGDQMTTDLATK